MTDAARLDRFECRQSTDDLKRDLELTCVDCEAHICDVEADDTLSVFAVAALDHRCQDDETDLTAVEVDGTIVAFTTRFDVSEPGSLHDRTGLAFNRESYFRG